MKKKSTVKKKTADPRAVSIGVKIKKLRIKKGYSAYDLFAFEHGISRVLYWRMEKGTNFTIGSLLKVLDAHKMTLREFFKDIR